MRARSFAKINLYLDVLPRRPDGFHDIETIFQTVNLCDEISVAPTDGTLSLTCTDPALDCGPANLVLRAAAALRERTGTAFGARIELAKRIPVAAGLAGGSGDAAATLTALNELWKTGLSKRDLAELGLTLGSDVPYCLAGGTAAATGRGEEMRPLEPLVNAWFVLVHPGLHVSTREVYRSPLLERNRERREGEFTPSFRSALDRFQARDWSATCFNRMEAPVFALYPQLAEIKSALLDAGCAAAIMSGSGPTMFGVCVSPTQAQSVAAQLAPLKTTVVMTVPHGVEISL